MKRLMLLAAVLMSSSISLFSAPPPARSNAAVSAAVTAYRQALVKKDLVALQKIWSDDYTFINAHGRVRTKADRLDDLRSGTTSLESITHEETPRIVRHGDLAIVYSTVTIVGRYDGKESSSDYRSTHLWRYAAGHWQLLMNQLTRIDS